MHSLNDTYRFFYNSPLTGQTQCYPANDAIDFVWEKTNNFYRRKIKSPLKFIKDDFTALHQIERSDDRCEKIDFTIEIKCGESFLPYWSGFLPLVKGNFQVSKCFVDITPSLEDEYTCFLRNWDKEKDFIGGEGAPEAEAEIRITRGTIQTAICEYEFEQPPQIPIGDPYDYPPATDCITDISSWLLKGQYIDWTGQQLPNGDYVYKLTSVYEREVLAGTCVSDVPVPPDGEGWVLLTGSSCPNPLYGRPVVADPALAYLVLKNGRKLTNVIQYLLDDCGLTLKSDFYNHNYVGDSPSNFAYTYADAYLGRLFFYQITDVKDPNADEQATKGLIKLKELLESLQPHHNIEWAIENGEFILEHASFFADGANMLDLTQDHLKPFIAGKHEYKYLIEELPRSEKWVFSVQSQDIDFDGVPITYEETCSYDEDGKDVEYPIGVYNCDITHIVKNRDKYSDESFALIAVNETSDSIVVFAGELSGAPKLNGPLALSNTMYYLQRHKRPQRRGVMNNQPEQFYNVQKKRAQPELSIPICCEDLISFNPNDYVRSQLGWGEVAAAKYNTKTKLLSLELNFD